MKKTLIYTCATKEYICWIPLYCLGMLKHNKNIDIEIGCEGELDDNTRECINFLKNRYQESNILIKENFILTKGNKTIFYNKRIMHNTLRFLTEPILKCDYVYIGDIDIICLEENIFQQHIKHMEECKINYSNIVRKNAPTHLSGLHFSKYESLYPLPDLNKINIMKNDEEVLKDIVILKGNKIDVKTTFRPIHGIHFSKNRPTVKGNNIIPGWEADGKEKQWFNFTKTEEYKKIYPLLSEYVKKQIIKLEMFYKHEN